MRMRSALDLGHALRAARRRRGWSQAELADHVGVHRNWVGKLERGQANPTWDLVLRLTDALGLDLDLATVGNEVPVQYVAAAGTSRPGGVLAVSLDEILARHTDSSG